MTEAKLQAEKPEHSAEQPTTSPRKRRRRAPTTGAADDCFACQERHSKCDRRRPYCTQCLDQGKDCSGYKTTLTWGVGVASRGKLRGLALPIAKSRKVDQGSNSKTDNKKKSSVPKDLTKLSPSRDASQFSSNNQCFSFNDTPTTTPTSARSTSTTFNFVNMDPSISTASPMLPPPSFEWRAPVSGSRGNSHRSSMKRVRRHSLQPLHVPALHEIDDLGVTPMTTTALSGFADHDFRVLSSSPVPSAFSGISLQSPTYKEYYAHQPMVESPYEGNFFTGHETLGWPRESMSSSLSSDQSSRDYCEDEAFFADPVVANTLDNILSTQQTLNHQDLSVACGQEDLDLTEDLRFLTPTGMRSDLVPDDCGAHQSMNIPTSLSSISIGNTPGLQFLISYYDRVISPVIVAFDGPTNPYRSHILRLAVESETLQHAIAALSASNLRMRRTNAVGPNRSTQAKFGSSHDDSVRKSSMAHSMMDVGLDRPGQSSASEPSMEELYHKGVSIKALNEQLADPLRRKDDSILATLLMLCLYHICDTGVAKFKTQFAGVKKILALRAGTSGCNSKATNWLTIMFTWFDAMTATVNDREGLLCSDNISETPLEEHEWALENLAGCDGRLFKTIAKLGRLNLLSQNKAVDNGSPRCRSGPKPSTTPSPGSKTLDYYSMNYNRFDGNGWSNTLDEDETFTEDGDFRVHFWKEWTEIRKSLQDWQLESSTSSLTDFATLRGDRRDLYHISESFRYSALLYTERLAYPHLPSSAPNFQNLVTQSLYHIALVKSDVFLLWPLFITGTECVSEYGRSLIKNRCLDIQKDSGFFNNISGLELLEKVWRDDTIDEQGGCLGLGLNDRSTMSTCASSSSFGQGFKWRKAMDRVDGEYIVV